MMRMGEIMTHVLVIAASQQKGSQSRKVADYLVNQLQEKEIEASLLDLGEVHLPLWAGVPASDPTLMNQVGDLLAEASSFVFVSPEWNGMAPPALKNLLTWFGNLKFAHKPALLCAISSGQGGAFVIAELRGSSYKNSRICYLPEHLIIRDVSNVLEGDGADNKSDAYYRDRIDFALQDLLAYDQALSSIRPGLLERMKKFVNGMS